MAVLYKAAYSLSRSTLPYIFHKFCFDMDIPFHMIDI
jgi:hypothetical protein